MNTYFKLEELKEAYTRLKEGLDTAQKQLEIDGVLQRFEFTFELAWKAIQEYAKYQGILLEYLEERNKTTHIYDAKIAKAIFDKMPRFASLTDSLIQKMSK